MRYRRVEDGEWISPIKRVYRAQCCDCGLVHRVEFRIAKSGIQFRVWRDERATAAVRREQRKRAAEMKRKAGLK